MKIYFKHRKTNFRKKEQIPKFLFLLIKKKEEGLQAADGYYHEGVAVPASGQQLAEASPLAARRCRRVPGRDVGYQQRSGQRRGRPVAWGGG